MKTTTYKVTCTKCKQADEVVIDDKNIIYWKPTEHIISGRYRLDMQWGWECVCGNYDILTKQEKREIKDLAEPNPSDISKVLKDLIPDAPKFTMESY